MTTMRILQWRCTGEYLKKYDKESRTYWWGDKASALKLSKATTERIFLETGWTIDDICVWDVEA